MPWVYLPILMMFKTPCFALRTLNGRVVERQSRSVMTRRHCRLRHVVHASSTQHAGTLGRVVFGGVIDEQSVVSIHCHHVEVYTSHPQTGDKRWCRRFKLSRVYLLSYAALFYRPHKLFSLHARTILVLPAPSWF